MSVRVNAIALSELLVGLQDGCHSVHELSELSGLSIQTVRYYLKQLHKRGIIHIADWTEDVRGSRILKVFELGVGKDVPKPKPKSKAAACVKWRAKNKQKKMLSMMATQNARI